ncbi:MAG: hypothetical protein LAO24_11665 [Acidobacteriia bacterium]|nr:hypothetical protein [Terriglobia bacterium]
MAQTPAPVLAGLVQRLDASKVKVGDPLLAKLALPWKSPACDLRTGAIIQGHVVTQRAHSRTEKTSEIGVIFESGQCGGRDMKPLFLTVAAVVAPNPPRYSDLPETEELQPLTSAVGVTLNSSGPNNMRSVSQASTAVYFAPRRIKAPDALKPGQVVGIPHLAISVGQGAGGASILSSTGRNVQLNAGTQFVLVPNLRAEANVNAGAKSATPDTATTNAVANAVSGVIESPPPNIADERELCVVPDCTVALADSQLDQGVQGAQITLPLKGLGYLPPSADREMSSFDYDASIAYLGPSQFLFTFNPHTLVPRTGEEANSFRKLRIVRAVLIDLEKKEIVKTVDWRVPDSGRYLWPIGGNRVLIHVGQELRVYGPGLQLRNQISLGGPLAFVRISPASEYFAAGVIHEQHSREIHRQLEEAELREPEEDVEIRLLDSQFKVLTTITRSSRLPAPVLLNEGEVHIPSIGRNHWRIVETSWAGQRRVLAVATSTCVPQAESLPGNLLFVVGCDRQTGNRWYRILHGDGKVVLKGWSPSSELEQTAGGNVGSNAFAIRIAEVTGSRLLQSVFKPSDLKSARVTVYRATNGHRIFSIGLPDPVPAVQTFAISPREDQVALLKADEIAFYRVSAAE